MAAESSGEWWLKVPMNGSQKFRGIFLKQFCMYNPSREMDEDFSWQGRFYVN